MARSQREAQVGLVVILSVICLIAGMLWFKQVRFAGGTVVYQVDFPSVDALQVRDRVQVRGIRMGVVADLAIVDDYVRVTIRLDRRVDLRQDATIKLGTIGIVGEKVIEIDPGHGAPAPAGTVFAGQAEPSLTSMGTAVSDALQDVHDLTDELRRLLGDLNEQGRLVATIDAARSAAGGLGEMMNDNRAPLRALIADFQATASALRVALAGPDSGLASLTVIARHSLVRADSVLADLERSAASLAEIVARLQEGGGSAGRLLTDDGLYARADSTLATIDELIRDVRRNPRRYFKFSVIDF